MLYVSPKKYPEILILFLFPGYFPIKCIHLMHPLLHPWNSLFSGKSTYCFAYRSAIADSLGAQVSLRDTATIFQSVIAVR